MLPPSEDIRLNLMLAEFAQVHAGKLTIVGAGLFAVYMVSGMQQLAVCGTIQVPFAELNRAHKVAIELFDDDDHPEMVPTPMGDKPFLIEATLTAALPPMLPKGSSVSVPFSVLFTIPIRVGNFHFKASIDPDKRAMVKLPFAVLQPQPGMLAQTGF